MDDVVNITDSAGIIEYVNGVFNKRFGCTLTSSPVFEENRLGHRVFVLREEMYGKEKSWIAAFVNPGR